MNEGDIALAPLPQADGRLKYRPVVLLRRLPPFGDFLVCGVSTQLQQRVPAFDEVVTTEDADFSATGLKAASVIRLGFLAVLPETHLAGSIGAISVERHRRLLSNLCNYLLPLAQADKPR
jgi:mRNA interferase MazF